MTPDIAELRRLHRAWREYQGGNIGANLARDAFTLAAYDALPALLDRVEALEGWKRIRRACDSLEARVSGEDVTIVLSAARTASANGWEPIEMAPKDGTEVLVYVPRRRLGPLYASASNPTGDQWWGRGFGDLQPTHWCPLPAPPVSRDREKGCP